MTDLQWILIILAVAAGLWQAWMIRVAAAMHSTGKYSNIRIGIGPGILAVILLIVVVLL